MTNAGFSGRLKIGALKRGGMGGETMDPVFKPPVKFFIICGEYA
jgi:hypothetical protein